MKRKRRLLLTETIGLKHNTSPRMDYTLTVEGEKFVMDLTKKIYFEKKNRNKSLSGARAPVGSGVIGNEFVVRHPPPTIEERISI